MVYWKEEHDFSQFSLIMRKILKQEELYVTSEVKGIEASESKAQRGISKEENKTETTIDKSDKFAIGLRASMSLTE